MAITATWTPPLANPFRSVSHNLFPFFPFPFLSFPRLSSPSFIFVQGYTTTNRLQQSWIPPSFQGKARVVVGIEYDQRDDPQPSHGFTTPLSLCQWTLAASPGHALFRTLVSDVVAAVHSYARRRATPLRQIHVAEVDVGSVSGPGIFTQAVLRALSLAVGEEITFRNLTGLKTPRLFGDVLVLPVDAFGQGQPHSGSSEDEDCEASLVRHQWSMSWRDVHNY